MTTYQEQEVVESTPVLEVLSGFIATLLGWVWIMVRSVVQFTIELEWFAQHWPFKMLTLWQLIIVLNIVLNWLGLAPVNQNLLWIVDITPYAWAVLALLYGGMINRLFGYAIDELQEVSYYPCLFILTFAGAVIAIQQFFLTAGPQVLVFALIQLLLTLLGGALMLAMWRTTEYGPYKSVWTYANWYWEDFQQIEWSLPKLNFSWTEKLSARISSIEWKKLYGWIPFERVKALNLKALSVRLPKRTKVRQTSVLAQVVTTKPEVVEEYVDEEDLEDDEAENPDGLAETDEDLIESDSASEDLLPELDSKLVQRLVEEENMPKIRVIAMRMEGREKELKRKESRSSKKRLVNLTCGDADVVLQEMQEVAKNRHWSVFKAIADMVND